MVDLGKLADSFDRPAIERHRFYDDPVGFADACIRWPKRRGLTAYQREIIGAVPVHRKVAVRGPHGLGKTTTAAVTVLWFALTRDLSGVDWKIATTAGAWRQLEFYLWPEIKKWSRLLDWAAVGCDPLSERSELLALNLKLGHGQAFAAASDNPALIEGVHADAVLYIFDESKAIVPATFDAAEGAFSGAGSNGLEAFALAMSTPGEPNGRFFDIHSRRPGLEDWHTRHVTVDEAIDAGRISSDWVEQRRKQWGAASAVFANRVLGEFHSSDEDGVVPLEWIEAANERWNLWDAAGRPTVPGVRTVGVDVARSGSDSTVMALLDGVVVTELRRTSREDTMQTTGRVQGIVAATPGRTPIVDVIGVGGGVVDRLRELGISVTAFNASEGTSLTDRSGELGFINARSAAWWRLRELLDPAYGAMLALPPDDLLTGDLTAPHWRVMSGGKIQIEGKDDIRKRIGRSPDSGDAVMQAVWESAHDNGAAAWIAYLGRKVDAGKAAADAARAAADEAAAVSSRSVDRLSSARTAAFQDQHRSRF
ncbi:MAG: pas60 [Frankiales bacterium]|nr:pas60 [Frankiales bacterium]